MKIEEIVLSFLRSVSILFKYLKKEDKRKNCFRICEYTFLIFEKGDKRKNCVSFCNYTFLIFEKSG